MERIVEPELLDELAAADPRAVQSRADLRRLNRVMGHARILSAALRRHLPRADGRPGPPRWVELGAGDGILSLRLARRAAARGVRAHVTLLDRRELVSPDTRRGFAALGWRLETVAADAAQWLGQSRTPLDVVLANLFLHHFDAVPLRSMLRLAAERTDLFVACEPRRSPVALAATRFLRLLGCNAVTRHDAPVSVRAGFAGREIGALWPTGSGWTSTEGAAGPFGHCFVAKRNA